MLEMGKNFFTSAETERQKSLDASRMIFSGKHRELFYNKNQTQHNFKSVGPNFSRVLYIVDSLPGSCTLKHADLLFGEELVIEAADANLQIAEAIKRISSASGLHPMLYDLAVTSGWAGRGYLQVVMSGGVVRIESIDPANIFPKYAAGTNRLAAATVKTQHKIGEQNFGRVIEHVPGKITLSCYRLSNNGKVESLASLKNLDDALPDMPVLEQPTGIDGLTVVEVQNYTTGGRGASDYSGGGETLIDEINNRLSQISRVLDMHGDPAVVALEDLFDADGNLRIAGKAIKAKRMDMGDPVKYVTWNAELEPAANQLERAINAFLRHMEVSPILVGLGGNTSADGWKKYKLSIQQTLARINRKQIFIAPAIREAFRIAMLLENAKAIGISYPVPADPVNLTFSDGLPVDETDLMNIVTGYYTAGLMSRKRSLMWIHSDAQIVDEELAAILAEQDAKLPTGFRDGMMGLAD